MTTTGQYRNLTTEVTLPLDDDGSPGVTANQEVDSAFENQHRKTSKDDESHQGATATSRPGNEGASIDPDIGAISEDGADVGTKSSGSESEDEDTDGLPAEDAGHFSPPSLNGEDEDDDSFTSHSPDDGNDSAGVAANQEVASKMENQPRKTSNLDESHQGATATSPGNKGGTGSSTNQDIGVISGDGADVGTKSSDSEFGSNGQDSTSPGGRSLFAADGSSIGSTETPGAGEMNQWSGLPGIIASLCFTNGPPS